MMREKRGEEQRQVAHEELVFLRRALISLRQVHVGRQHDHQLLHDGVEEALEDAVELHAVHLHAGHLGDALQGRVAEDRPNEVRVHQERDQLRLEDVPRVHPRQERAQRLERHHKEAGLLARRHDEVAKLEDLCELVLEGLLQDAVLRGRLVRPEEKHLLAQQLQDAHVILADLLIVPAELYDLRDEVRPLLGPLLLHNLHEHQVHLVEEGGLIRRRFPVLAQPRDDRDDVLLHAGAMLHRHGLPLRLNGLLQNLRREDLRSEAFPLLNDRGHRLPHALMLLQLDHDVVRLPRARVRRVERDVENLI
mmetsp:Transcript_19867/g.75095  ORF Transcript_19867/g.75095 Transcript_19867/m.75095 type:complete len:307 (+) Transcript_19867:2325-3245(+)